MGKNETASSVWPIDLIEKEVTEAIENRFTVVEFVGLRLMGGGTDYYVGAEVN